MERLEPIPSPPGHLLREFCHRFLPIAVFTGAICLTTLLWNRRFTGTTTFGEVEPIRANIVSAEGGTLSELLVDRFQTVTNGQVLATIQLLDPDAVRTDLAVLRSDLQVLKSRMSLDEARNAQNVESIRAQWLEARVDLATARVNLENARREVDRLQRLRTDRIVSDSEFEAAESLRDALTAEVTERSSVVAGLSESVQRLADANQREEMSNLDVISQSLQAQEQRLRQQQDQKLRATMDGVVKVINHRPGERVPAGEVVVVITATRSERIIGYIRQPLVLEPRPGMPVEIRTRGPVRQTATSKVLSVGVDLEMVVSPLRLRGFDNSTERGLAFAVELPASLNVHPGELVDLIVQPLAE
ncbi:MAG: HlyD family efflux transporter periplasmic adaptor subunit [Verrucomicrobiales bacterium]|nr:HlyD family efflux transporter periplasmic adaptor subunit [Verrucomicrobiales bacterium]